MSVVNLRRMVSVAIVLALVVVMLGAYTRLTDAGLGCPDWPGCYGRMVLPTHEDGLLQAQNAYPAMQLETRKAWTEMVHRYAAGSLGLFILYAFINAVIIQRNNPRIPKFIPVILLLLVFFQALLGMWTVTLKLLPIVVMAHLLGGVLILASLCYFRWQISEIKGVNLTKWTKWIGIGCLIVLLQIALGGWVSSNYAGIACVGFPTCNGVWLPQLHWSKGFNLFSPVGANYQGGLLDVDVRITIQFIHRVGAVITAAYVLFLTALLMARTHSSKLRIAAAIALILVVLQLTLGVLNVLYFLPLSIAVAHNGVAALLLVSLISLFYLSRGEAPDAA